MNVERKVEEDINSADVARSPSFGDDKRISSVDEVSDGGGGSQLFSFPVLVDSIGSAGPHVPNLHSWGPLSDLDDPSPSEPESESSSSDEEEVRVEDSLARSGSEPAKGPSSSKWGKLRSLVTGRSRSKWKKHRGSFRIPNPNPNSKKKEEEDVVPARRLCSSFLPYRQQIIGIFPPGLDKIIKRKNNS